jgi:ACS family allantoate permease-like MFS transporter
MDPRFYIVFLLLVSTGLPNGGITAFGPAIIKQFGFTTLQSTLLNAGSGACTVLGTGLAWYVAKWTGRTFAGIYTLVLAAMGCLSELAIPQ